MSSAQIINISSGETLLKQEVEHLRLELNKVQSVLHDLLKKTTMESVMIYDTKEYRRVSINEIIQIQSDSNYSTFYLDDGSKILTSKTLKYWETTLMHPDLVRIHKSNLININKIKVVNVGNSEITLTANLTLKYSRMSKSDLLCKLKLQF
jgi:two-component system LytT family response regulator